MIYAYGTLCIIFFALVTAYISLFSKRDIWFLLTFLSMFVCNIGYLAIALSKSLDEAMLANRIAYLGIVSSAEDYRIFYWASRRQAVCSGRDVNGRFYQSEIVRNNKSTYWEAGSGQRLSMPYAISENRGIGSVERLLRYYEREQVQNYPTRYAEYDGVLYPPWRPVSGK